MDNSGRGEGGDNNKRYEAVTGMCLHFKAGDVCRLPRIN